MHLRPRRGRASADSDKRSRALAVPSARSVAQYRLVTAATVVAARGPRAFVAQRVLRISRVVADLRRAERFYGTALGFRTVARGPLDPGTLRALRVAHARSEQRIMRLGADEIALVQFRPAGAPASSERHSNDLGFQHLAIVVRDMPAAYARLVATRGWAPISVAGPERLPAASGGVQCFKFRDPDGHALELIWFPRGSGRAVWHRQTARRPLFLGIDHTALAVTTTKASLGFYRGLGLEVAYRSRNRGPAQSRLDRVASARLSVVGLRTQSAQGPGVELLAYEPPGRAAPRGGATRLTTDWISLLGDPGAATAAAPRALKDPDGHRLVLLTAAMVPAAPRIPNRRPARSS
jgi:catechol 2,3-dioxygenase-like lactoylglutathione lyase family enzyme